MTRITCGSSPGRVGEKDLLRWFCPGCLGRPGAVGQKLMASGESSGFSANSLSNSALHEMKAL